MNLQKHEYTHLPKLVFQAHRQKVQILLFYLADILTMKILVMKLFIPVWAVEIQKRFCLCILHFTKQIVSAEKDKLTNHS